MIARLSFSQPSHLLSIAEDLAGYRGSANLKQTAMRRAVSNAYYAVFHALCAVCADGIVVRGKPDLLRTVYRSIDHGPVKRSLLSAAALATFPDIAKIADLFAAAPACGRLRALDAFVQSEPDPRDHRGSAPGGRADRTTRRRSSPVVSKRAQ